MADQKDDMKDGSPEPEYTKDNLEVHFPLSKKSDGSEIPKSNYEEIADQLTTFNDQVEQTISKLDAIKNDISKKDQQIQILLNEKEGFQKKLAEIQAENNIPAPYLAIPLVAGFALGGFLGYNLKPKKKKHRDIPDNNSELI